MNNDKSELLYNYLMTSTHGDTLMHSKKFFIKLPVIFLYAIILSTIFLSMIPSVFAGDDSPSDNDKNYFSITPNINGVEEIQFHGLFQTDYRYYAEQERPDNRFMVRRAQIEITGRINSWLTLNLEYEFKNDVIDHLLDTYAEIKPGNYAFRIGHYKKPFGLEIQTEEESVYFAERSMGSFLSPGRDVGIMIHGSTLNHHIHYAGGLFNAEGDNVANRGNGHDEPEVIGRIVFSPFAQSSADWLKYIQFGGSVSFAKTNLGNLDFKVKTTGMIDTTRNIYVLSHDTKFGVLQDIDDRWRFGVEGAWAWKTFFIQGEYIRLTYSSLKPVSGPEKDADFFSWYVSALWMLTGEQPTLSQGTLNPIRPDKPFDLSTGDMGAVGIAARFDHFKGDEDWINPAAYVSVRKADSASLSLNWILMPMHRILLDYTYSDLSDPIRVKVNPDGSVDYIDLENVITLRYCIDL